VCCIDRLNPPVKGDGFAVTQECVANLLGVQRVGVTVAAGGLQMAGGSSAKAAAGSS
jgi:hypothetical protein